MSNKTEYHMQTRLRNGTAVTTTWLPEKFATVGKVVDLEDQGVWSRGWTVEAIYAKMDSKYVNERSQDYKRTRKASDI